MPGSWADIQEAKDDDIESESQGEWRLFWMKEGGQNKQEIKGKWHKD